MSKMIWSIGLHFTSRALIIYLNLVVIYNRIGYVKNGLQYWSPI